MEKENKIHNVATPKNWRKICKKETLLVDVFVPEGSRGPGEMIAERLIVVHAEQLHVVLGEDLEKDLITHQPRQHISNTLATH